MWLGLKLWPLSNELNEYVQRSSLSSVPHIQDTYVRQSVCVCVYLLNTCEILYPYLVFACVEACFAIVSALPPPPCPRILLWHLHLLSPRCAAKTYAPCVCVCVCVSATVHLFCVYLSILYLARERFLCHCANYTKTTTSGSTDNVCHHMHHSARSNPPPLFPLPQLPLATVLLH